MRAARAARRVREHLADERENHDHACVGVPSAKEILSKRVLHIPAALFHQRGQQKISPYWMAGTVMKMIPDINLASRVIVLPFWIQDAESLEPDFS